MNQFASANISGYTRLLSTHTSEKKTEYVFDQPDTLL